LYQSLLSDPAACSAAMQAEVDYLIETLAMVRRHEINPETP
jgi:hypothetical protein